MHHAHQIIFYSSAVVIDKSGLLLGYEAIHSTTSDVTNSISDADSIIGRTNRNVI
jgi:hypothetical protein